MDCYECYTRLNMANLEENISDLHLSIDSLRQSNDPFQQPNRSGQQSIVYLSNQSLNDIPDYVLKCTTLKNLYLKGNNILGLPNCLFSSLPHLVWLDLRNNQLTSLPPEIGQHRCLKTLLLEGNPITELPVELGNLVTLQSLSLRNCPILFPPQDVLQQGLTHILRFLRCKAVAQRPVSVHGTQHRGELGPAMPAVEKLPLSKVLQSSLDLCEEDDTEVQRFNELRQRMLQMERADLGDHTTYISLPHHLRAVEGDRSPTSHLPSIRRTKEISVLTPSEERRLAVKKELKEKQDSIEQRRKDEEVLRKWRNQAKIMQEKKILEYKQDRRQRNQIQKVLKEDSKCDAKDTKQRSFKEMEEASAMKDQELEQRIRTHVQMMQQRRTRPRGSPREEAKAAAQEMEEIKQLQLELLQRRRERELEYRFTAFTGKTGGDK